MNCKKIPPENIIKLSATISLILVEKFDADELNVIKNLMCSVANNISSYLAQEYIFEKCKQSKNQD